MPKIIVFICIWLCCGGAFAASSSTDFWIENNTSAMVLPGNAEKVELQSGISYFFETDPITAAQAAALPADRWTDYPTSKLPYLGMRTEAVWLRFDVRNLAGRDTDWLMEIFWTFLNTIEVYQHYPRSGKWADPMVNGLLTPIELRPIPHRLFLFPMKLPQGQISRIYIRCWSNSKLIIPIRFFKQDAYDRVDRIHSLVFGIYFGILAVMLCYNLSLSIFTQDKSYLLYSVYVFSIIIFSLMSTGFGPFYIWDQSIWLKTHGYIVLSNFVFLCVALFVINFLSLKKYGGWPLYLSHGIAFYWGASMVLYTLKPHQIWVALEDPAALISAVAALITAIYIWSKGNISARYFIIAWGFLIVGTFFLMLGLSGLIPFNHAALFSQMVGFVIEVILLSLALAERFNREKNARENAQQEALELSQKIVIERKSKLAAQERLLQMQRHTKEELEFQVKERTRELEQAMSRLEEANNELAQLNIIDPLTKVHNRQYFDEIIESEIERALRSAQPLSLLMVDIDHFKAINDNFGHLVGDQCLQMVAKTIRENVARVSDLVARYGGEEFALVLPGTTPADALGVAEKVRAAVEKLVYIHQGSAVKLRVSIGVAGWVPIKAESSRNLIQVADQALYQAKRNGRNRVEAAVMAGDQMENTNQAKGMESSS